VLTIGLGLSIAQRQQKEQWSINVSTWLWDSRQDNAIVARGEIAMFPRNEGRNEYSWLIYYHVTQCYKVKAHEIDAPSLYL